ncbi:TPA: hypothetical protein N0F65_004800 [Lagenidium giganteum]|uniref:Methyltransferase domain-containing protein n=1 Tax=Lagenidium giganteum TaxID=4803 RepID=A0AAV2ZC32_9STRA|nr:TPA: hypothetical protein N0F65_004800 [Lagenidium giganteum]
MGNCTYAVNRDDGPNTMAMSQPLVLDEADDATLALSVQPTPPQDHALQVPTGASNATLTTTTTTTTPQTISWHKNVERRSGFWGNAYWYDYNLERRMPQVKPMVEELVAALPPCDGKTVVDVCAGSGRVASALLQAYPTALVTLVDSSEERLALARNRIQPLHAMTQYMVARVSPANPSCLGPSVPVDTIVGCLALHVLVEKPQHYAQAGSNMPDTATLPVADQYERLFALMLRSLKPGGHFIFADHVGQLGLFHQLQLMAKVGFVDVDCAWRQDEFFVAGGQSPMPLAM